MNVVRKMIIKIVEVLLPHVKSPGFFDPVDFRDLVTRQITVKHFNEAQHIVIDENFLAYLDQKFQVNLDLQWSSNELSLKYAFQKLSSFTLKDVKFIEDEWKRFIQIRSNMPHQENGDSPLGRGSILMRASILSRSSISSQATSPINSQQRGLEKHEFQSLLSDSFSTDSLKREILRDVDLDCIYEAFSFKDTGKIDFK